MLVHTWWYMEAGMPDEVNIEADDVSTEAGRLVTGEYRC